MVAEALGADNVIALQGDAQMAVFEGWGCVKGRACGGKGIRRFVVCGCRMPRSQRRPCTERALRAQRV